METGMRGGQPTNADWSLESVDCRLGRGFSLIELMVTAVIIAAIAGLLASSVMMARKRAKIKQNELLLQDLARAWDLMKRAYEYSGAVGVDDNGEPLPDSDLANIDVGWELDPKNEVWGAGGKLAADLCFNKRLRSFYLVKRNQTAAGRLVDVFGNTIVYTVVERSANDPFGNPVRMLDEYIISHGPNGQPNDGGSDDDDQIQKVGTYKIRAP